MNRVLEGARLRFFLPTAAVLLLVALVIDMGFTRPRLGEVRRLKDRRDQLLGQVAKLGGHDERSQGFAKLLKVQSLTELLEEPAGDPLAYIGSVLEESRLTRLDLATMGSSQSHGIRRTRFALRTTGSYGRTLEFMRKLETGSRVATIDAFWIEALWEPRTLESRINLTICDPLVGESK